MAKPTFVSYFAARKKLVDALGITRKEASHLLKYGTLNGVIRAVDMLRGGQKVDLESWKPSLAWYADEDVDEFGTEAPTKERSAAGRPPLYPWEILAYRLGRL